ncbi:ATP-binding cassette domain-containing protein [Cellulosimicrobium sp. BIT-GX5]|uniref:ABC-type quaternary amine transporter n=1 Tax=Cellulosimicrobium composti TaxID=2672572 RepID=A0A6N7ZMC9_9MICO|nr:ABC transporter ATP-binding protein [Cellulosimicrobium composti]MTG90587.1 ATP-binding cassette domain-containing protein [Cellulosimicrobium composti]
MVQTDPAPSRTGAPEPSRPDAVPDPDPVPGEGAGLAVRDVVVRYGGHGTGGARTDPGTTAVAGVTLDVPPGEVLALLGPSGCGKSSLLRAVAGLEPVASGAVAWDGRDLAGVPVHRRGFGLMFQEGQLFPHRDVAGNVAYGIAGLPRAARDARVTELLDVVGLAGYGRRAVATLSGGERQRVALARSLAPRPRLLLLDEPLSALDRGLRERLALDLREALRATGTTAVFVTHDHDEAFTVADRVAVMDAGRLLQVASPEDLWRAPASRRVAEFLGYQAFVPAELSAAGRSLDRRGADNSAYDGSDELLAIGPRGLRVVGTSGASDAQGGSASSGAGTWVATVVGSVFRRGAAEITVDVVLPGADPGSPARLVALAGTGGSGGADEGPEPGARVHVAPDPAGCAVVRG